MAGKKKPVLSIESLTVDFDLGKTCHAVRDTSVCIEPCLLYTSDAADE